MSTVLDLVAVDAGSTHASDTSLAAGLLAIIIHPHEVEGVNVAGEVSVVQESDGFVQLFFIRDGRKSEG